MANLVISAAGAAVGYFIGGPTGASIGWALGSALGPKEAANQTMSGTTIGDLKVQTSQYGTGIPICVGKQRVSGNIMWATDKTAHTNSTTTKTGKGGGGGSVTTQTTTYTTNLAIGICKGSILGVSRVWADGKLIIDATNDANPLIGNLYTGSNSQMPDATMESHLGAGNVPAYRGLAYIVLTDFDLGQQGRIPMFSFEVIREGGL